jgi:hypothetical protein
MVSEGGKPRKSLPGQKEELTAEGALGGGFLEEGVLTRQPLAPSARHTPRGG